MRARVVQDNVASSEGHNMRIIAQRHVYPITRLVYRAWLRSRLDSYERGLHAIAAQRANDFHAERLLHRAISSIRSKLQSL
jgi:hypothetical protein